MIELEDLNYFIRYFAERIEKLIQFMNRNTFDSDLQVATNSQQIEKLIRKYQEYIITTELEMQLMKKLSVRILQIFGFCRAKSKSQATLIHLERQIRNKLNIILGGSQPNVGKILKFIDSVCRKDRFMSHRHNHSVCSAINNKQSRNNKEGRKLWSRFGTKQIDREQNIELFTRKTNLILLTSKNQKNISKQEQIENILKLYGMNIDRNHLLKCMENKEVAEKQQMKRNFVTIRKMKHSLPKKDKIIVASGRRVLTQLQESSSINSHQIKCFSRLLEADSQKMTKKIGWKSKRNLVKVVMRRAVVCHEQQIFRVSSSFRDRKNKQNSYKHKNS